MKLGVLSAILAAGLATTSTAATLYLEDFTGQDGDGLVGNSGSFTSSNGWTATATGVNGGDRFSVLDGAFSGNDTNEEAVWLSPLIDVAGFTSLSLMIDFFETGDLEGPGCNCGVNIDYLNLAVLLDGVSIPFLNIGGFGDSTFSLTGDSPDDEDFGSTTFVSGLADAASVQISIAMRNSAGSETIGFDNISLTGEAIAAVPLPAGGPLLLAGLAGVAALRRRSRAG